jgi:Mrp family chromosome partitioning ATPase
MQTLLQELSDMSDLVILDSPPLLTVSDLLPLVGAVSGVVVVARLNATSKDAIRRLATTIAAAHGTLLGSVATGAAAGGRYYGGRDAAPASGHVPSGAAARLRRLRQPRTAPPA